MSYGIQFLVICALVVLGCGKVTLQGRVSRGYLVNTSDSVLFNAQLFLVMALVLAIALPLGGMNLPGIFLAVAAGLGSFLFQTCYALALRCGPVSLSVMIVNFSVLFITAFSVVAYRESVYLTQLIGICFLVLSMILSVKKDNAEKGVSGKWLILIFTAMSATAVATILMKVFVKGYGETLENSENTFVILMYTFASLLAVAY